MKTVRLLLLTIILLVMSTTASAEIKGWGLGAGVLDGDFGIQGRKDFWLGGDISQITGQASVYFHNKTTFRLDADYHFIINPGKPSRFYPLGGLQFAFNSDSAKLGLNVGGGVNFMLTEKLAAFAELKYVIGDWDGWAITGGIYF
jgi:opacity protein-like surface antigen